MLKRVQFEEWQAIITLVAFIIFSLTFLYLSWRAIRMRKPERDHLANLPLESEKTEADHEK
jgi:membrane protein implicated in regulation of membrane protease activity